MRQEGARVSRRGGGLRGVWLRGLSVLALLCLTACSKGLYKASHGYGDVGPAASLFNDHGSGEPIALQISRTQIGGTFYESDRLSLDVFFGAFMVTPEAHESSVAAGPVLTPRIVLNSFEWLRPYVAVDLGLGYANWDAQGSDFGFLVGGGPGVLVPVDEDISITLSWSLFHWSNAGIAKPNPGLNSDVLEAGVEFKF